MPAANHYSYGEELERCNYTLRYVEKALESTLRKKERIDKDLDRVKRHFNGENSQDYIDIIVNTALQNSADVKLRNLAAAVSKPYFSRIDFKEVGRERVDKLYIGKMALIRDEDQELIIVDWRAPVANLYYEGRLGDCSYACPEGVIQGEMLLKRQFTINKGVLEDIFDIDVTTTDALLQSCLGASADSRLKDIVSTIQAEQNKIIRADMWTPLIMQGAAGSGKTTIALHRIAYLIYNFEKSFKPENFMIIAPNKLFLNYISDVLPELGVEKVRQTTFEEFAMDIIGKKFKVKDANEKLAAFVNHNATEEQRQQNEKIKAVSRLKASMLFKQAIDEYIERIEKDFIPKEDFTVASVVVYRYEEINNIFINEYKNWPIVARINEIKKHLKSRLRLKKEDIINRIHDECDLKIRRLKLTMEDCEERQKLIIEAFDKKTEMISNLEAHAKKAVNNYLSRISKLEAFTYYKEFITDKAIFGEIMEGKLGRELIDFAVDYTSDVINSGMLDVEDLAPIIYLKFRIYGMDEKIPVRHIVMDEAQDFSPFQFYVLKKIVKDSSFTLLGDLSQGIHGYRGTRDWDDVRMQAFDDRKSILLTLEQSYRTTVEIMRAANTVIRKLNDDKLIEAKPVIRHGEEVKVIKKEDIRDIARDIGEKISGFLKEGCKSVAIICKTLEECKVMHGYLKKNEGAPYVITGKEDKYKSGVVIVPSYLAKGLEFDAVIISNANISEYRQDDELDVKLLYVAMTRPLHKLVIYYHGELSPLLSDVATL